MEKIFVYRYTNEYLRYIFMIEDECYEYKEPTMETIFIHFSIDNNLVDNPDWAKEYEELDDNQKKEVLKYKEERKDDYKEKECSFGYYKPSNYYRDELSVYAICITLDRKIFNFSEIKYKDYKSKLKDYKRVLENSIDYEKRKQYDEKGFKK